MDGLSNFIKQLTLTTVFQIGNIFGVFLLLGLILYLFAKWTQNCHRRSHTILIHIFLTGWIGIPVHEIGHAVFAVIFGHKIVQIKLFSPDLLTGTMGYVKHSWNRKNPYHRMGNFFIGAGPIILGAFLLAGTAFLLVPSSKQFFNFVFQSDRGLPEFSNHYEQMRFMLSSAGDLIRLVFKTSNFKHFSFWIFLYLALCISAHMELSPSDLKSMFEGFWVIILIMLSVNSVVLLFKFNPEKFIQMLTGNNGLVQGIFFLAVIISFCNFILTYILTSLFSVVVFKRFFNPFI